MLKRYHGDGNYIICWDSALLDENLSYEEDPVAILDREVRKLRPREIASIKVQWKNLPVEEATWEKEADMQETYPHLFTDSGNPFHPCFPSFDRSLRLTIGLRVKCGTKIQPRIQFRMQCFPKHRSKLLSSI